MQIKTTRRYHFTQVRMAIINKSTNNKFERGWLERLWRKGNPSALLVEWRLENSMEIAQKSKNGIAI